MLVSNFSVASAAGFPVAPCALARTETRLPAVGATPRTGVQGYTQLVTSTGPRTATPVRQPAASVPLAIPNEMLRAQSELPLDDAIHCTSSPSQFDMSPFPRLRTALFANS